MVYYDKLWHLLIDKNINKKILCEKTKISSSTMAKMSKNENVSMDVITRICEYLNCDIGDIMEMIPDDGGQPSEEK
jgi:DNA-binding Xre family transcriptional regulator